MGQVLGKTCHACHLVFDYCGLNLSKYPVHDHVSFMLTQGQKLVTRAAQVVDASHVVFAFARDNAPSLPG